jgi:hypothetical protein
MMNAEGKLLKDSAEAAGCCTLFTVVEFSFVRHIISNLIGFMRRMVAAGTIALAFCHFPKRPVNSAKAFQQKYNGSFFHSL